MRAAPAARAGIGVDKSSDRAIIVGKGGAALVLSKFQSEPLGLFGEAAGSALDRLGELGGVRGCENNHRRSGGPALGARGRTPPRRPRTPAPPAPPDATPTRHPNTTPLTPRHLRP